MTTANTQSGAMPPGIKTASVQSTPLAGARFWDRMATRYAARPVPDPDAYAHKLNVTREYLDTDTDVLEIGCGTGATAIAHAPFAGHIIACDYSSGMLDIARQNAATAGVINVEFLCEDAGVRSYETTRFDVVLALNVLHLLRDWPAAIRRAYRQLRPGGVFISSTPCLQNAPAWLRCLAPFGSRVALMPWLSFFGEDELADVHMATGFDLEYSWQASRRNGLFLVARKSC